MTSAGRICPLPKGDWSAETTYDFLDFVNYSGKTYIAKKVTTGDVPPASGDSWQLFAGSIDVAMQYVGSIAFAQLAQATKTQGYVYNITDAFTTTSDFLEGAGHSYSAGANVMWTSQTSKWDVLSGHRDTKAITINIPVAGWTGSGPFTNTVADANVHDRMSFVMSTLTSTTTPANAKTYRKNFAMLMNANVGEGTVTFSASAKPTGDFSVNLIQGA